MLCSPVAFPAFSDLKRGLSARNATAVQISGDKRSVMIHSQTLHIGDGIYWSTTDPQALTSQIGIIVGIKATALEIQPLVQRQSDRLNKVIT
jgi:hypothetical protein